MKVFLFFIYLDLLKEYIYVLLKEERQDAHI